MQSIEPVENVNRERIITIALPPDITPGKHRVVLVIDDATSDDKSASIDDAPQLMQMAGKVTRFNAIEDPVAWQQLQRDEWGATEAMMTVGYLFSGFHKPS
jgi:hypothetical protein